MHEKIDFALNFGFWLVYIKFHSHLCDDWEVTEILIAKVIEISSTISPESFPTYSAYKFNENQILLWTYKKPIQQKE
jgi:hypothetical protein